VISEAGDGNRKDEPQVYAARFAGAPGTLDRVPAPACTYRGIHGSGRDDVWIVGDEGCILHFDGVEWSRIASEVKDDLYAVSACGPTEAWAVGEGGTVLQWNGTAWRSRSSGTANDLLGVTGCLSDDVWAVGAAGVVLKHAK
jgi:photosystem II stability/assembly factor-like uncharacterized protein